jgi:hypothetical protein
MFYPCKDFSVIEEMWVALTNGKGVFLKFDKPANWNATSYVFDIVCGVSLRSGAD